MAGPFDRFNDRAKRVLALAQDEAIRLNHNYFGVEHLLRVEANAASPGVTPHMHWHVAGPGLPPPLR